MKKLVLLLIAVTASGTANANCLMSMENAAIYSMAEELSRSVKSAFVVRSEMGAWTEAVGNNTGSGEIAIKLAGKVQYYQVHAQQVGSSEKCKVQSLERLAPSSIDRLALQAEGYRIAIGTTQHMSESDEEWTPFYSHSKVTGFKKEEMARALKAQSPVDIYTAKETESFFESYIKDDEAIDATDRNHYKRLKEALKKDFKDFRVIKVGEPDSGGLDLYIIGITPEGELVGLHTITVET
jgi:hypothetical protein